MTMTRRQFGVLATGAVLASGAALQSDGHAAEQRSIKAIAFDAFPIFDPRPIAARVESLFPGKGNAIMNAWRVRQFEYQWLRALAGKYADFLKTTKDSLRFVSQQMQLDITSDQIELLMAGYSDLQVWPDAVEALRTLHGMDVRLAFLSNMTRGMLVDGIENAGLQGLFAEVLSTDDIQTYKPDPRAYRLAEEKLNLQRDEILFVAFAGWDVAGAKWYGYPTFWVNRLGSPREELGIEADGMGRDLGSLVSFVKNKVS